MLRGFFMSIGIVCSPLPSGSSATKTSASESTKSTASSSSAASINDHGDIVGQYTLADGSVHGFVYRDGQMIPL